MLANHLADPFWRTFVYWDLIMQEQSFHRTDRAELNFETASRRPSVGSRNLLSDSQLMGAYKAV